MTGRTIRNFTMELFRDFFLQSPLPVRLVLVCRIRQNTEFIGDRNIGEGLASPGLSNKLTPAEIRISASALRIEQQTTDPFCSALSFSIRRHYRPMKRGGSTDPNPSLDSQQLSCH